MEAFVENILRQTIEISERITPASAVLTKRWVVERMLARLNHFQRLSKDYEISTKSVENIIMIVHSMNLFKRLC